MSNNNELKDEMLKDVAGGLDCRIMDDCEANMKATKDLISAFEGVLAGNNNFSILKDMFYGITDNYEHSYYSEAYNKTIELKNTVPMFRNVGDESFNKFVNELENYVLAIDFGLRQFCTNFR